MKTLKSILAAAIVAPVIASAGGFGLVVPVGLGYSETIEGDYGGSLDREIGTGVGIGVAWDTNMGKDVLINKRTTIEYISQDVDYTDGDTDTFTTFNISTFYGYGILRNENIRLAIGPRINVQYTVGDNSALDDAEIGIGIAPAIGINWNINKNFSLSADADYKFQFNWGALGSSDYYSTDYSSTTSNLTARVYVMYRFGEDKTNYISDFDTAMGENSAQ